MGLGSLSVIIIVSPPKKGQKRGMKKNLSPQQRVEEQVFLGCGIYIKNIMIKKNIKRVFVGNFFDVIARVLNRFFFIGL